MVGSLSMERLSLSCCMPPLCQWSKHHCVHVSWVTTVGSAVDRCIAHPQCNTASQGRHECSASRHAASQKAPGLLLCWLRTTCGAHEPFARTSKVHALHMAEEAHVAQHETCSAGSQMQGLTLNVKFWAEADFRMMCCLDINGESLLAHLHVCQGHVTGFQPLHVLAGGQPHPECEATY